MTSVLSLLQTGSESAGNEHWYSRYTMHAIAKKKRKKTSLQKLTRSSL